MVHPDKSFPNTLGLLLTLLIVRVAPHKDTRSGYLHRTELGRRRLQLNSSVDWRGLWRTCQTTSGAGLAGGLTPNL